MEYRHPLNHSTALALPPAQRGVALVVALIMLVMVTMFALAAFKMGKGSLEIVGNMQQRNSVVADANDAIQEAISATNFTVNPNNVFTTPCTVANTRCYDTNGDGTNDVLVTLTAPKCIQAQPILNSQLNLADSAQAKCVAQTQPGTFGIAGAPTNVSFCSNSVWQLAAQAVDQTSLATSTVTEGVAVRVATATIQTTCP